MVAADTLCYCCSGFFVILLYPCSIYNETDLKQLKNMKYLAVYDLKICC